MDKERKLVEYVFDDYKIVINFETFEDAEAYAREKNGELIEVSFTDGNDNPRPDDGARLIETRKPWRVKLGDEYKVLYSEEEGFQEMAQQLLVEKKELQDEVAPEDWIADQNIATGDRIIVLKDGEFEKVTTRERIKFLMRGDVYELGVKVASTDFTEE